MTDLILILQILSCFFLTGLIWTIQVVHYPSFAFVTNQFSKFHIFHSTRISFVVIPMMLIELLTAIYLVWISPSAFAMNACGVVLVWMSTFFLSVPIHNQLSDKQNTDLIRKLILTNWPRTILWTLRSLFWAYYLFLCFASVPLSLKWGHPLDLQHFSP